MDGSTLALFLESEFSLLVIVFVLASTPIFTALKIIDLASSVRESGLHGLRPFLREFFLFPRKEESETYFPLVLGHVYLCQFPLVFFL